MSFLDAKETQACRVFASRTLQNLGTKTSAANTKQGFLETQNWLIHIQHNAKIQNNST